jgi:Anti-sigma-K factor rskA/Putative zinc-finger
VSSSSSSSHDKDRFEELLGPYLLGQLSAQEDAELEHHLQECPSCQGELEALGQTHTLLRELAASEVPEELKAQLMLAYATAGELPAHEDSSSSSVAAAVRRWELWVAAAAAAALVAVVLAAIFGIGVLERITVDDEPEASGGGGGGVALEPTALAPQARGELRGEKAGQNFEVELEVGGLPELREDEYYEMWYAKQSGGRISCGTFRVQPGAKTTTVQLTAPLNAVMYPKIEVTREPDDGDPGTSGKEVLVGDLRDL